jgi:outer membrane biosynthesis protein TonB
LSDNRQDLQITFHPYPVNYFWQVKMANLHNHNPNERNHVHHNNVAPDKTVAYRDGYIHGRVRERHLQEDGLEVRDNNNAARGLLIGITLTSLVGLALAAAFFWYPRQQQTPAPVVVPAPSSSPVSSPAASQGQTTQTTTIERHTVEQVPVTQPAAPASQPNVNVTVPQTAPASRTDVNVNVPNPSQQPANSKSSTTVNVNPAQPQTTRSESSNSTSKTNSANNSTNNDNSSKQNKSGTSSGSNSSTGVSKEF